MKQIQACQNPDLSRALILSSDAGIRLLLLATQVANSCLTPQPHRLEDSRLPCPSSFSGVYLDSCPLSWWCHPTILPSVTPFFSCPVFPSIRVCSARHAINRDIQIFSFCGALKGISNFFFYKHLGKWETNQNPKLPPKPWKTNKNQTNTTCWFTSLSN